jgi:two-component system sensor histidine kinase HydH
MTVTPAGPSPAGSGPFGGALREPWTAVSVASIAAIVAVHYLVHGGDLTHAVLRRLPYLPIGLLAVRHGLRGGLLAGVSVAVLYLPHAFFAQALSSALGIHIHADPSPAVEKLSELILYVALGALVGTAVDAARRSQTALGEVRRDLVRTTEDLRRAERLGALGELAAGIAHEIRNPLTALRTTAELLAEAYPEGHKRHRMAQLHLSELDRLDLVVQKFLDFARPKPPAVEDVDATALLGRAQALLETTARDKSISIDIRADEGLLLRADPDLLLQVLLNLGLNAVQHSQAGGEVVLGAMSDDETQRLTVEDSGDGVAPEVSETLFDPCVTTRPDGSGLGLSIASRIIEAHGGQLSFTAREGGGTRFQVILPRAQALGSAP